MKKLISISMAAALVLPAVAGNGTALAAEVSPEQVLDKSQEFVVSESAMPVPVNVLANVYEQVQPEQSKVTSSVYGTVELDKLDISTPNGMAYHNGDVYVAQGSNGISSISLATREVTSIVQKSNLEFQSVTLDSEGNLYYVLKKDHYIKKLNASFLTQLPLTADQLQSYSTDYASIMEYPITGIAMSSNDQLYISVDSGYSWNPGILRWNEGSQTIQPVFGEEGTVMSVSFDSQGNLYFKTDVGTGSHDIDYGIHKVAAADLEGSLPIDYDKVIKFKSDIGNPLITTAGLIFVPGAPSYISDGKTIERVYPEGRPFTYINGKYTNGLYQGDTFVDPGITIEDEKYTEFEIKKTYSRDGQTVDKLDTMIPGVYTIHYTAVNPANIASTEVTRKVTVYPPPAQLIDWNMIGITGMDADQNNFYFSNKKLTESPDFGLYKISLSTNEKTKLAEMPDISAVAVNTNGDLFFARGEMHNMIFKIEAKYLQTGKTLTANELMRNSKTYMPFSRQEAGSTALRINGLQFDSQGRLYASIAMNPGQNVSSKIVRLTGKDWNQAKSIADFSGASYDLAMTPTGDLLFNGAVSNQFSTYKLSKEQLNGATVPFEKITKLPATDGDYGVVVMQDGTGYVSIGFDYFTGRLLRPFQY